MQSALHESDGLGLEPSFTKQDTVGASAVHGRAHRAARSQPLAVLIGAIVVALSIRIFAAGIYVIPTRSMEPTLHAGDVLLVSKLSYWLGMPPTVPFTDVVLNNPWRIRWSYPQRGEVIVFRFAYHEQFPNEPDYFVKRIVGMPGDTLWVVGDSIYQRPPRHRHPVADLRYGGKVMVPAAGMTVELHPSTIEYWRPLIEREGNRVAITRNLVLINGESRSSYTFAHNYYYVLGDNRASSFDSRYWGFVSDADIIGKPVLVLWSKSPGLGTIRWERIGSIPR